MARINNLEDLSQKLKFLHKYQNLANIESDNLLVIKKNILNLGEETSYLDSYNAIKDDIFESCNFFESVLLTLNNDFFPLEFSEIEDSRVFTYKDLTLRTNENEEYFIKHKDFEELKVDRENLSQTINNILFNDIFEKYFVDTKEYRKWHPVPRGTYKQDWDKRFLKFDVAKPKDMFDKSDKYIFAKNYDRRVFFETLIKKTIEKLQLNISKYIETGLYDKVLETIEGKEFYEKEVISILEKNKIDLNLNSLFDLYSKNKKDFKKFFSNLEKEEQNIVKTYIDIVEGKEHATVSTVKKDSVVIKKDQEKNTISITQNPLNKEIQTSTLESIQKIKHLNNLELDRDVDFNKLNVLLKALENLELGTNQPYTFKVRLLGKHNATELYLKGNETSEDDIYKHIVAIDLRYSFSFIKALSKHIISNIIDSDISKNFINFLENRNDYSGMNVNNISKYSNPLEVLSRAAEVSYSLNQGGFSLISKLEELKLNFEDNKEEIEKLKTKLRIEDIYNYRWQDVILNNEVNLGIVKDFKFYLENEEKIYFDLENLTIKEVENIYVFYQNIFNYEGKINKELNFNNSNEGSYERESYKKNEKIRRKGLETYTTEDFKRVKELIEEGLVEIPIDIFIEDCLNLTSTKARNLKSLIHLDLMNLEQKIKYNVWTKETALYLNYNNPLNYRRRINDFYEDLETNLKIYDHVLENKKQGTTIETLIDVFGIYQDYKEQFPFEDFSKRFTEPFNFLELYKKDLFANELDKFETIMFEKLEDISMEEEVTAFLDKILYDLSYSYNYKSTLTSLGCKDFKNIQKINKVMEIIFEKINLVTDKVSQIEYKSNFVDFLVSNDNKIIQIDKNFKYFNEVLIYSQLMQKKNKFTMQEVTKTLEEFDILEFSKIKDDLNIYIQDFKDLENRYIKLSGKKPDYEKIRYYGDRTSFDGVSEHFLMYKNIKNNFLEQFQRIDRKKNKEIEKLTLQNIEKKPKNKKTTPSLGS